MTNLNHHYQRSSQSESKKHVPHLALTAQDHLTEALRLVFGEDFVNDDSTKDTASRVLRYWQEMSKPLLYDCLNKQFDCSHDQIVLVDNIEFYSLCEHHLLPFFGNVDIAYIPKTKVVGLSKLPRLVDVISRRPQIQERLTVQIGKAIEANIDTIGVAVIISASHTCMSARGVGKVGSRTKTSYLSGAFKNDSIVRQELMELLND